jgi:hypothetical protein
MDTEVFCSSTAVPAELADRAWVLVSRGPSQEITPSYSPPPVAFLLIAFACSSFGVTSSRCSTSLRDHTYPFCLPLPRVFIRFCCLLISVLPFHHHHHRTGKPAQTEALLRSTRRWHVMMGLLRQVVPDHCLEEMRFRASVSLAFTFLPLLLSSLSLERHYQQITADDWFPFDRIAETHYAHTNITFIAFMALISPT